MYQPAGGTDRKLENSDALCLVLPINYGSADLRDQDQYC